MSVAALRTQFGLLPTGDPYGDLSKLASPSYLQAGTYSVVANRHLPRLNVFAPIYTAAPIFLKTIPYSLRDRYIPYSLTVFSGCPQPPINFPSLYGGQQGAPFSSVGSFSSSIPGFGAIVGPALGALNAFFSNPCTNQVAQFNQVMCQISGVLTQLINLLDQAVGLGRATPGQAAAILGTYGSQVAGVFAGASGQCYPYVSYFANAIEAQRDFSETIFWPDIYPKPVVVNPAQPTITTPTPAPANQFAATPAVPPAAVVPSIVQPPNSLPGSPKIAVPIVQGVVSGPVNYGIAQKGAPNFQVAGIPPAQPLPQGVGTTLAVSASLLVPLAVIGGIIAAMVLL